MADRAGRSSFGPTLALGVGGAVLVAVAGSRSWMTVVTTGSDITPLGLAGAAGEMPLATPLSLVVLAAWGVALVSRGRLRRTATGLAALAALGVLGTVVSGWWLVPDTLRAAGRGVGVDRVLVDVTAWFWVALVAAVVSAAATLVAVLRVGAWPEMGTRYDAPTGDPADASEEASPLDLGKALDQGRGPTA